MEYTPEQLASLQKERPKNETEKRFVLSKEDFSKKRLGVLKEEVDALKEKYPEVLSFCVYGSMVKGTAHERSDIDGWLFVDSKKASESAGESEENILEVDPNSGGQYFKKEVGEKYILELRQKVKEGVVSEEDELVKHMRVLPISEKMIDKTIEEKINYYNLIDQWDLDFRAWLKSEPPKGSSLDDLISYEKSKPVRPKKIDSIVYAMFHLDVGGGIRPYRKFFIDKLLSLGERGEKIWEDTIMGTQIMENDSGYNIDKRYPGTLQEAAAIYA